MRVLLPLVLLVAACEPMPPSGDPLAPVSVSAPARAVPVSPAGAVLDDPFADEPTEAELARAMELAKQPQAKLTPEEEVARQAALMGVAPLPPLPEPGPEPVAQAPQAMGVLAGAPVLSVPAGPPSQDWGVRLVQTLVDVQPPRAVLGLPDGREVVVQPGTLLPDAKLVVLAVGRNAVQVARVVPEGYYARVEPFTVSALFAVGPER